MEWQYNFGDKVFSLIQRGCLMKIKESPSIIGGGGGGVGGGGGAAQQKKKGEK